MAAPTISDQVQRLFANESTNSAALPATVNAGDRIVAQIGHNNAALTLTAPSGWTFIASSISGSGTSTSASYWYYRDAPSSEGGASFAWGTSGSTDTSVIYVVFAVGTFNPVWPVLAANNGTANPPDLQYGTTQGFIEVMTLSGAVGAGTASPFTGSSGYTDQISATTTGTNKVSAGLVRLPFNGYAVNPGSWTMTGVTDAESWTVTVAGIREGIRGTSTAISTTATTTWTTNLLSNVQTGDDVYVAVYSRDHTSGDAFATCTDNDSGGNTYSLLQNSADRKAMLFWKKATSGTASKTITIAGAIGSSTGAVVVMHDRISGDPTTSFSQEANASGNETHAGFTATNGSVISWVVFCPDDVNYTGGTMATLGAYSGIAMQNASTGGSDSAVGFWSDEFDPAGATGNFTWAQANVAGISFAFESLKTAGDQDIDLDTAIENELGKAITPKHQRALSPATENELGKAFTATHQAAVGEATEQELARAITPVKPIFVDVGTATEQELGDTITPTRQGDLNPATEQELARAITPVKPILVDVGTATEQELATEITADKPIFVDVGTATEVELGRIISPLAPHEIAVNPAAEQELANPITPVKPILVDLGPASEQELARAFTAVKPIFVDVGQAIEQELARIIAAETSVPGKLDTPVCEVDWPTAVCGTDWPTATCVLTRPTATSSVTL